MMAPPLVVVLLFLSTAVFASAAAYGGESALSPDLHHIELLSPILLSLGYQEIAMAVNSVLPSSINSNWSAPVTLFAPSDDSVRSCPPPSCSPLLLLRQHLVPGLLTAADLTRLPFGSKLETADAARCLAVTSTASGSKMFVDGVEITRPDLFVGGQIAIHGLQGFVAPLSPLSCSPPVPNPSEMSPIGPIPPLMLRDAIVRLHHDIQPSRVRGAGGVRAAAFSLNLNLLVRHRCEYKTMPITTYLWISAAKWLQGSLRTPRKQDSAVDPAARAAAGDAGGAAWAFLMGFVFQI